MRTKQFDEFRPYPYQSAGVRFLVTRGDSDKGGGGILADAVGLGKTAQAILAAQRLGLERVLLIVPKSLKPWWVKAIMWIEAACKSEAIVTEILPGVWRVRPQLGAAFQIRVSDYLKEATPQVTVYHPAGDIKRTWVIAHPEQFVDRYDRRALLQDRVWDAVIVDEAHKSVRNPDTQRGENIRAIRSNWRWALTATPMSERPADIWGLLNYVAPWNFQSKWSFIQQFQYMHAGLWGTELGGVKNPEGLAGACDPFMLTRNVEDVQLEMPPDPIIVDVPLELDGAQKVLYNDVTRQMIVELCRDPDTGKAVRDDGSRLLVLDLNDRLIIRSAIGRFTRCHQVASAPQQISEDITDNIKLEWLQNYVEGGGKPAVVLTRYRRTVEVVTQALHEWLGQAADDWIVGTYGKLSHGHNLQHLHNLILWDLTFSGLEYIQGVGRVHRQGQTDRVWVYRLIAADTVDENVLDAIDHKIGQTEMVMAWLRHVAERSE